jgi:hypothetical protein
MKQRMPSYFRHRAPGKAANARSKRIRACTDEESGLVCGALTRNSTCRRTSDLVHSDKQPLHDRASRSRACCKAVRVGVAAWHSWWASHIFAGKPAVTTASDPGVRQRSTDRRARLTELATTGRTMMPPPPPPKSWRAVKWFNPWRAVVGASHQPASSTGTGTFNTCCSQ